MLIMLFLIRLSVLRRQLLPGLSMAMVEDQGMLGRWAGWYRCFALLLHPRRHRVGRVGRHVDRDGADGQREISPTATLERARAAGSEGAPRSPGPPGPANLAAGNEDAPVGEDVPEKASVWSGQPPPVERAPLVNQRAHSNTRTV